MGNKKPQNDQPANYKGDLQKAIEFVIGRLKIWLLPPVKRKIYKVIYDRLLTIQESLYLIPDDNVDDIIKERISKFTALLVSPYKNETAGWDLADTIKEILVEVASPKVLYGFLVEEKGVKMSPFCGTHIFLLLIWII